MNKKLLAVAVAGALALPGVALAQSSVTISGLFSISLGNLNIGSYNTTGARAAGSNSSESRITDNSSRIVFSVVEDLGGGLQAIGQIDWRVSVDNGADTASNGAGGPGGNNHVGLRSKSWGRILIGRQDLHYFNTSSDINAGGRGDLKVNPFTILAFLPNGVPVGNASRTPSVVHYTTPNWGGFTGIIAYSMNPIGAASNEADIGCTVRKGRGWNVQPDFQGPNWQITYSYLSAKADCGVADDQRGDRLAGSYAWGGLKVGLAWDRSRLTSVATGADTHRRTAWSIPVSYTWGPNIIEGHYTKARDDQVTAAQDGAKMFALQYTYNLSKRTSLSATYSKITNDVGAAYNFFAATSGAIGHASAGVLAGEDPRLISASIRHAF